MNSNTSSNISNVALKFERCFMRLLIRSALDPSSTYVKNHITICIVNTLFSIVGTVLNSIVLYIFWKSQQRRSKMSYFGIMVMSSVDIGVVTIVQPLFTYVVINEIFGKLKCYHYMAFALLALLIPGVSASTVFVISIQRYFSIVRPILHHTIATKKRFLLTNLLVWFIYLLFYLSRIFSLNYNWIVLVVLGFIFCCTSLFVYSSIFLVARKKLRNANHVNSTSGQDNSPNLVSFLRELKLAKTYILIALLLFICYLPYTIALLYTNLEPRTMERAIVAVDWTLALAFTNSTLNCCVFYLGEQRT